ncbi:rCG24177, partial [Rattus norvegicus]
MAKRNRK